MASTLRGGEEPFLLYVRGEKLFGYALGFYETFFAVFYFFFFIVYDTR